MQIDRPDHRGLNPLAERLRFLTAMKVSLLAVAGLWLVTALDQFGALELYRYGLYPRSLTGLRGALFAPLIHSGWDHLLSNSLPLLIGLMSVLYVYPRSSRRLLPVVYFGSSLLAWTFARPSFHIGASGVVFGLLAFLLISGLLRRDLRTIAVSMMVWFLYASMIWGLLPIREGTSWEMHLSGAICGVIMAFACRRLDLVKVYRYSWEDDDTPPEWYPEQGENDQAEERYRE